MDYKLRRAVENDKLAICGLFNEMIWSIYKEVNREPYADDYLASFFVDDSKVIFVADSSEFEHIIGYISVIDHIDHLYIDDFCVTELCRSNGVGTSLLRVAEAFALGHSIKKVALHVEESNKAAQRLYYNNGYDIYSRDGNRIRMIKWL